MAKNRRRRFYAMLHTSSYLSRACLLLGSYLGVSFKLAVYELFDRTGVPKCVASSREGLKKQNFTISIQPPGAVFKPHAKVLFRRPRPLTVKLSRKLSLITGRVAAAEMRPMAYGWACLGNLKMHVEKLSSLFPSFFTRRIVVVARLVCPFEALS